LFHWQLPFEVMTAFATCCVRYSLATY
jgi:hypothetical protein